MNSAIICFGSNIEPEKNAEKARELLAKDQALIATSAFLRTKPEGYSVQPDYLNGAFLIQTELSFEALKTYLKGVENLMGRIRTTDKHAPRTIDLDIVVYNGKIISDDYLIYYFVKKSVDELLPLLK
ncbi:MAG TPA: 2-amino-4-hydroxy-6-hydroxymethyldihydropteridine diphosphokinase [Candidatus Nanoarchaeia archaeon]|nr:2-amino-4-hydroxy-6-hydroxymethyldihydropteridine diphosphokinase [Candidatus Nanoarchaeia archaeon]